MYMHICLFPRVIHPIQSNRQHILLNNSWCEAQVLPGSAQVLAVIDHSDPIFLIHRHVYVVGVRPKHEYNTTIIKYLVIVKLVSKNIVN